MSNAFSIGGGVYFATIGIPDRPSLELIHWDGSSPSYDVIATTDAGAEADLFTVISQSIGPLHGGYWWVHARRDSGVGSIVVRVDRDSVVTDTVLTAPDSMAFLPAATLDACGRLHVIWYDSSGSIGVLRYTHSVGVAPFDDGFVPPVDIDPNACPGGRWHPGHEIDDNGKSGRRRLREYIGIAADAELIHVAWTHSPAPPSRVHVATIRPLKTL